jgi:phosphoglycerate dehydrogenase-like enzyme
LTEAPPDLLRVAVLDDYEDAAGSARWSELGRPVAVDPYRDHIADRDELARQLEPYDVVVAMRERTSFDQDLLLRLDNLKLLVTTGMANAAIDLKSAADRGVTVCGTGGIIDNTVELTWALVLAAVRDLEGNFARFRTGRWGGPLGRDLAHGSFGVLGLGRIGTRVARVARAFSMTVLAWSPHLDKARAEAAGARLVTKEELFRSSDVLSVHMVLSEATRHLVGRAELALMAPHAILVNTSRGLLVDEAALLDALRHGQLAGAALDVYSTEPLPADHPLRTMPSVVGTTHIGYATHRCFEIFYDEIVEDIQAWLSGRAVRVLAAPDEGRTEGPRSGRQP